MKNQLASLTIAACCALSSPAHAQIKAWNPSCAQVLALGYDRYAEEYGKRTYDYSTAGMTSPARRYQECKEAANTKRLQVLAAARRARVQRAQRELEKLESALWPMTLAHTGGGTMYSVFAAVSAAKRSDAMGKVIAATQRARRSNAARAQANAQWKRAFKAFKRWEDLPSAENATVSPAQFQHEYKANLNTARQQISVLEVLGAQLPDEAALVLARRTADSVTNIYSDAQ